MDQLIQLGLFYVIIISIVIKTLMNNAESVMFLSHGIYCHRYYITFEHIIIP